MTAEDEFRAYWQAIRDAGWTIRDCEHCGLWVSRPLPRRSKPEWRPMPQGGRHMHAIMLSKGLVEEMQEDAA